MLSRVNRSQQTSAVPYIDTNVSSSSGKNTERSETSQESDLFTDRSSPILPSTPRSTSRDTCSASSTRQKKRPLSSKEIIHNLFNVWQPQLSSSYRPHVHYVPTDFTQFRAFSEMSQTSTGYNSVSCENHKFRAAERVVETVNMLSSNSLSQRGSHPNRRTSCVKT